MEHAKKLHEAIRREFPEIRVYKFWEASPGCFPLDKMQQRLNKHIFRRFLSGPTLFRCVRQLLVNANPRAAQELMAAPYPFQLKLTRLPPRNLERCSAFS